MAKDSPTHIWLMRGLFAGLSALVIMLHLLPLSTLPARWAPPDLMLAFTCAWVLRRPDYAPLILVAAVFFMADLLLQRPPGLLAALVVIGCNYLETRAAALKEASFIGEWLAVCLTITAITVTNRVVLMVLAVDQAQLSLTLIQMLLTMVFYPIAAGVTHYGLRVRKLAPGDAEIAGGRA